jgi:signal transduction histidine kinase
MAERRDDALEAARRRVIEAGDTARRKLAHDVHDGAQQQLVTAVIKLQLAQQKWRSDPEQAKIYLDDGLDRAVAGLRALRELSAGIHPAILVHHGLGAAIEALADEAPLSVTVDAIAERLPEPVETSLYFLVSEALTNVVKHSGATSALITIAVDHDFLVVEVKDNGSGGFESAGEGTGMLGMRDRVAALDGVLSVDSALPTGTTVHVQIPMQPFETA